MINSSLFPMLLVNDMPITVIVNGGVAFGLFLFLQYFKFERKRGPRNFKKENLISDNTLTCSF